MNFGKLVKWATIVYVAATLIGGLGAFFVTASAVGDVSAPIGAFLISVLFVGMVLLNAYVTVLAIFGIIWLVQRVMSDQAARRNNPPGGNDAPGVNPPTGGNEPHDRT